MKKCTRLWREAHFKVKMCKAWQVRNTFGSLDLEKVHAVAARKNTSTLEHFWKLRSRKSARRYVARYLWTLKRRFLWLLEHQIFRFAKITLRNSCSISYALRMTWHHFFVAYFRQMELKNRKTHWYEAVSSALNFPLLKEVSQNCFVFDVVKSKNWGSLAEFFCSGASNNHCCRKPRRTASWDRQIGRQIDRQS